MKLFLVLTIFLSACAVNPKIPQTESVQPSPSPSPDDDSSPNTEEEVETDIA